MYFGGKFTVFHSDATGTLGGFEPAGPIGHINEIPHFSYSTGYTTVSLKLFIIVHSVIHSRESGTQKGSIPWAILDQKRVIMKIISLNFFITLLFNLVSLYVYS